MHALGQLIVVQMEHPENHWGPRDIIARMRAAGHRGIDALRLQNLRDRPVDSIASADIFALADGLGVAPLVVANAALEAMGIDTADAVVTDTAAAILVDPTLSDSNRRQLLTLLREMRAGVVRVWGGFIDLKTGELTVDEDAR